MIKKTTQLKNLIKSSQLEFIMEAHNGLSSRIVEEAGFKGIWGSGLTLSASLGVRDNNEASWTQIIDILEFMSDATTIPILLDGDTGYGNFNNLRRLVRKLEQRDIAGVCIEDKLFPKTNSFINGDSQPLADIDEFSGKIKAAKDTQLDPDFVVVARVEAFIAGWGLGETLKRAEAYRKAGADAVLIHSKINTAAEIASFMKEWDNRLPVVIVPTKYYSTPTQNFRDIGISTVIWANHNFRAAVKVMQDLTKKLHQTESLIDIEENITSVSEIFRLQGADELKEAEKAYLPSSDQSFNSIVLAAAKGNLDELTKTKPKTLLKVKGKSILKHQTDLMNDLDIKDISVVRGFGKEHIKLDNIKTIDNDNYEKGHDLESLYCAKDELKDNTIISFGDIIYKKHVLQDLIHTKNDIVVVVDSLSTNDGSNKEFVTANSAYSITDLDSSITLKKASRNIETTSRHGEFIGLMKVTSEGSKLLKETMETLKNENKLEDSHLIDALNKINETNPVSVLYIQDSWVDVNNIKDLYKAGTF
jgi:phosphoenolpyruvate phosphomutase